MDNRYLVALLLAFSLTVTVAIAQDTVPLDMGKEMVTRVHFYFHDIVSGKNPTAVRVAQAATTDQSSTLFGVVFMIDDPLTEGPELTSKLVGRAQGLYGSAGQKEVSLIMALSYVFTDGQFNGSTLSVLARNPIMNTVRQFPIVGGTGFFQFARGIATAKTYWFNTTSRDAIVEYNLTVIHY